MKGQETDKLTSQRIQKKSAYIDYTTATGAGRAAVSTATGRWSCSREHSHGALVMQPQAQPRSAGRAAVSTTGRCLQCYSMGVRVKQASTPSPVIPPHF